MYIDVNLATSNNILCCRRMYEFVLICINQPGKGVGGTHNPIVVNYDIGKRRNDTNNTAKIRWLW